MRSHQTSSYKKVNADIPASASEQRTWPAVPRAALGARSPQSSGAAAPQGWEGTRKALESPSSSAASRHIQIQLEGQRHISSRAGLVST